MAFNGINTRTNMIEEARAFMNDVVDRLDQLGDYVTALDKEVAEAESTIQRSSYRNDSGGTDPEATFEVLDVKAGHLVVVDLITVTLSNHPGSMYFEGFLSLDGTVQTAFYVTQQGAGRILTQSEGYAYTLRGPFQLKGPQKVYVNAGAIEVNGQLNSVCLYRTLGGTQ